MLAAVDADADVVPLDAELAVDVARHLGDADLQVHLGRRRHVQAVHHPRRVVDELVRHLHDVGRLLGVGDGAGQHQRLVDRRRPSPTARAPCCGCPPASASMLWVTRIRADISTLSFSSTAKSVVSPTPDAGQVHEPRRLHLDVGHLRVGDEEAGELLVDPDQLAGADHQGDRLARPRGCDQLEGAERRSARWPGAMSEGRGERDGEGAMSFHCSHSRVLGAYSVGTPRRRGAPRRGSAVARDLHAAHDLHLVGRGHVGLERLPASAASPRRPCRQAGERARRGSPPRSCRPVSASVAAVAHRVQHQRQGAERLRERDHLRLPRRDLERRGLGDRRALGLALLVLRAAPRARAAGRSASTRRFASTVSLARIALPRRRRRWNRSG